MTRLHLSRLTVLTVVALATTSLAPRTQTPALDPAARETAYRANNVGVTRLEQFDFGAATEAFRRALAADPQLAMARLNLGIALFYGGDAAGAEREIRVARPALGTMPQPDYMLGLIARAADRTDEARDAFARVAQIDPADAGTAINLGQLDLQAGRLPDAIAAFRRALQAEPYNATAEYGLATALLRAGDTQAGTETMTRFEQLRDSAYAVTYAQTYLEQGRYAEAVASTGAEPDLVDTRVPDVAFTDATSTLPARRTQAPRPARATGSVALFDLDGDGDLDLADSSAAGVRLFRNDAGRFTDVTARLGAAATTAATAVLAGDYDNDGRTDLLVLRPAGLTLLRGRPTGGFVNVTTAAALPPLPGAPQSAAWLDADHDGDLDLYVAVAAGSGTGATRLFRNNGNGRFTDITSTSGLSVTTPVLAVVPTDYDNKRDIDVLLVGPAGAPQLFRNLRDGTFRDVAGDVGLRADGGAAMAAVGDVNKDGYVDFFFARRDGAGAFALSNGRGQFTMSEAPAAVANARAVQFVDYDGDGLLDLLALTASGPRLLRNIGRDWVDVTSRAIPAAMASGSGAATATALAAGDVDGDGRVDLVLRTAAGDVIWHNAPSASRSLRVVLQARASNRSAVGAKIEMRAGSLRQQLETYAATPAPAPADVLFGLGTRAGADVVRVLWPSGILQAETSVPPATALNASLTVEELDRKPSSCPFLYTWNGERFEFITDFLGGGEMGYLEEPGRRNTPDPDEYVRIAGDKLRPRDGRYELRITNELEEVLFLDRVQLVAVAHPIGVEVHPNEGLGPAAQPFKLYVSRHVQPPLAATDDHGRDMLDRVRQIDRRYVDEFTLERVRGYAAEHSLMLRLPPAGRDGRRVLLLTGWTDYAFSADNVAGSQAGLPAAPPSLDVKGPDGRWHRVIDDIGFPVGRPQTVVVDLSGKMPASARDVRITTSLRVYWDQVQVDTSDGQAGPLMTRLDPLSAVLRWRGFSAEVTPDGHEPFTYDYDRVSATSPWKLMPGRYTREGDVRELLTGADDMFVISRPGDEIALSFDAAALPALPDGWTRTFLLYGDGFSKEMDLHSASPDQLLPLPFHGMTRYPYDPPEAYPLTPAHRAYLDKYNTRIVPRMLPALDGSIALSREP